MSRRLSSCPRRCSATARAWRPSCRLWMPLTELLRACRCREPGTGPVPAARLVAGQRRAGERGDERGRRCGAGEQGPLTAGSGPPLVEPAQQRGDRLGVAVVAERGIDMIQEAGAERRRTGGLPGDRVGSCPGEPVRGTLAQAAVAAPGSGREPDDVPVRRLWPRARSGRVATGSAAVPTLLYPRPRRRFRSAGRRRPPPVNGLAGMTWKHECRRPARPQASEKHDVWPVQAGLSTLGARHRRRAT